MLENERVRADDLSRELRHGIGISDVFEGRRLQIPKEQGHDRHWDARMHDNPTRCMASLYMARRRAPRMYGGVAEASREGMETAWVKEGKLVMRRAANPSMGAEVKGAIGSEQLQFRPVRFGTEVAKSDRANDRQIETIWCADFDKLRNRVQAEKGDFKVDKATAIGTVEVLFIPEAESQDKRRTSTAPLKSRTL